MDDFLHTHTRKHKIHPSKVMCEDGGMAYATNDAFGQLFQTADRFEEDTVRHKAITPLLLMR